MFVLITHARNKPLRLGMCQINPEVHFDINPPKNTIDNQ